MAIRVAINGFGRIGRLVYRIMEKNPDFDVVAINDPHDIKATAYLMKYDSIHGRCFEEVEIVEKGLMVDGHKLLVFGERDPEKLPWGDLDIDIVIESTGHFSDREGASKHLKAGAKRVLITCPAKGEDITIVMGVNDDLYDPERHFIVSNASCTTNCLAPFAKVLLDKFGIESGFLNTIHAYTSGQGILDAHFKDLRRGRAAAASIIPTTTGAARAVSLVLPELKGRLDGFATRVPVPDGSMCDLTVELSRPVTKEEVNEAMREASRTYLKGILAYTEDPVVSCDIIGSSYSSIFDGEYTMVRGERSSFIKCIAWYDNEWGYSCRVVDLARLMGSADQEK